MEETKNSNSNINTKDFIIGTLIGGIVGVSAALLLAPKSGKDLRSDINDGATQMKGKASEFKDTAQEKGYHWKDKAYTTGSELKKRAMDTTSQLTKNASDKTKELTKTVQSKLQDKRIKEDEALEAAEEVAEAIEEAAEEMETR
ncbi:YtxH domain-containing protein [Virgibacillus sp. SK37]|uniref:YtxH domain-containing protein n=1 Tax=Virgibacillus sp. SK37 TaxID=403957 RepID=UPI0004D12FAF|nr:YtxH domain-containing protein [Virgibacillus sp. SK37]AIF43173.1 hypothetical protein X953_08420 [Virgibacillus sp. SK37]